MNEIEKALETILRPIVRDVVREELNSKCSNDPSMKDGEKWLTCGQAAKEFGCSINMLYRAVAANEINTYQPGSRTYIRRKDVAAYLDGILIRSKDNSNGYSFLK